MAMGGFFQPIESFGRRRNAIFVTNGIDYSKRNPPLQKHGCLPIKPPGQLCLMYDVKTKLTMLNQELG
jgi:hypothetical protein